MLTKFKERLHELRRHVLPASVADVTWRHETSMIYLKGIDDKLSALQSEMQKLDSFRSELDFLMAVAPARIPEFLGYLKQSKAQLRQDLFVLAETSLKRNGFFVEFGATNGVSLSNTYLLESAFVWRGILAEPARCWHDALQDNRKCVIERKCVWSRSGEELVFDEVDVPELSTVHSFSECDHHSVSRSNSRQYSVETISLVDLLEKHHAPPVIDYLSIDTEGSEFEILNAFDFSRYRFDVITCEHNFTGMRQQIFELLTSQGYVRKYENLSQWDDWYVRA